MKNPFKKTAIEVNVNTEIAKEKDDLAGRISNKRPGVLDMVIAFDTTGSMAAYIEDVRRQVSDLIPSLFADNPDLRLGIVAFGDYCDMEAPQEFGDAFQCLHPTDNENLIMKFVKEARNTSGGDGDEFYELVLRKIIDETPWRPEANRSILLIADAEPHPIGYSYGDMVVNNRISWRDEARKAARAGIQIDTVTIRELSWMKDVSAMTNGISIPFRSGSKTAVMIDATVSARGSERARRKWDMMKESYIHSDHEMAMVFESLERKRYNDSDPFELRRFLSAHKTDFPTALNELMAGRKRTHWMWYMFPQLRGLGHSRNSMIYGIGSLREAKAYLDHEVLGDHLRLLCQTLLGLDITSAEEIFGSVDAMKLRSSMTLFDAASPSDIFERVLDRFFGGSRCEITLKRLAATDHSK